VGNCQFHSKSARSKVTNR